jgi:hypothetical protein
LVSEPGYSPGIESGATRSGDSPHCFIRNTGHTAADAAIVFTAFVSTRSLLKRGAPRNCQEHLVLKLVRDIHATTSNSIGSHPVSHNIERTRVCGNINIIHSKDRNKGFYFSNQYYRSQIENCGRHGSEKLQSSNPGLLYFLAYTSRVQLSGASHLTAPSNFLVCTAHIESNL